MLAQSPRAIGDKVGGWGRGGEVREGWCAIDAVVVRKSFVGVCRLCENATDSYYIEASKTQDAHCAKCEGAIASVAIVFSTAI